jgi:hypothetical protein
MDTKKMVMLAGAGALGYYLLGKKPVGALAGVAVLMLLTKPMQQQVPAGTDAEAIGGPTATGLPAPGTTDDPLGGSVMPGGKSIGILR